jgi:hypothetical protein
MKTIEEVRDHLIEQIESMLVYSTCSPAGEKYAKNLTGRYTELVRCLTRMEILGMIEGHESDLMKRLNDLLRLMDERMRYIKERVDAKSEEHTPNA